MSPVEVEHGPRRELGLWRRQVDDRRRSEGSATRSSGLSIRRRSYPSPLKFTAAMSVTVQPGAIAVTAMPRGTECAGKSRLQAARAWRGGYSPAVSSQTQLDGVTGDHMPSHCSAPQASNRSTSVNPSFAATHRADVGGLGGEHHLLAGKDAVEPAECRHARLRRRTRIPTPAAGTGNRDRPAPRQPSGSRRPSGSHEPRHHPSP